MPLVIETVRSRVLADNPLGDPAERRVPVFLPPGYESSELSYPAVYFLAGFANGGTQLLNESPWNENLAERLERLMTDGGVRPLIVVMPDCRTRYGGSQYIDSAATGRYEEHLVTELVPLVDAKYRTVADRDRRAVMGKSSGGYGATVLAMRHPDLFGVAVDHSGDKCFDFCYRADVPACVIALARYGRSVEEFLRGFPHPPESRSRHWFTLVNMVAMASCYSPNPSSAAGFDLPFDEYTGEARADVWRRWLTHDPIELAAGHAAALRSLRLYYLDCGAWDEHHLQLCNRIYVQRLGKLGIPHVYEEFDGGHMGTAHRYDGSLRRVAATLST